MKKLSLLTIALFLTTTFAAASDSFIWPNGAKAAVCLTYDDALPSQIDIAYPQLEKAGFKGTFFLQGSGGTMKSRLEDWRKISTDGHELASHSLFHPCRKTGPGRDWVADEQNLDHYSIDRIRNELQITNTLLQAIDGKTTRTFAYPCGDTTVADGNDSYLPITNELYLASRGVSPQLSSMKELDFNIVPAFDPSNSDLSASIAYLEDCYERGTVAVFLNHGVGGDYLVTDAQLHEEILNYLAANKDRFWVDTFHNVMTHTKSEFTRLGWTD